MQPKMTTAGAANIYTSYYGCSFSMSGLKWEVSGWMIQWNQFDTD